MNQIARIDINKETVNMAQLPEVAVGKCLMLIMPRAVADITTIITRGIRV